MSETLVSSVRAARAKTSPLAGKPVVEIDSDVFGGDVGKWNLDAPDDPG